MLPRQTNKIFFIHSSPVSKNYHTITRKLCTAQNQVYSCNRNTKSKFQSRKTFKPQSRHCANRNACFVVEVTGLEPTTSWSRTKRATKLRYTSLLPIRFTPVVPRPLGPSSPQAFSFQSFAVAKLSVRSAASPLPKNLAPLRFPGTLSVRATKLRYTSLSADQIHHGRSTTSWSLVAVNDHNILTEKISYAA